MSVCPPTQAALYMKSRARARERENNVQPVVRSVKSYHAFALSYAPSASVLSM